MIGITITQRDDSGLALVQKTDTDRFAVVTFDEARNQVRAGDLFASPVYSGSAVEYVARWESRRNAERRYRRALAGE